MFHLFFKAVKQNRTSSRLQGFAGKKPNTNLMPFSNLSNFDESVTREGGSLLSVAIIPLFSFITEAQKN